MPSLKKLLSKFSDGERRVLEPLIEAIISLNWRNLDIKKLTGYDNIFRARKGNIRVIFAKDKKEISILSIERRRESTYKF
jgi:mRNA-degrading endonuclease RelE of RelBE toxin-antitoxin system